MGCANATATKALNGQSHTVKGWVLEYVDRNLPECAPLRHELWLEKMNRISPSKQRLIELSMLAKERKERVNQKVKEIKEKYRLGFSLSHVTKYEAVKEFRRLARAIVQIDLDGKPVREWENMARAENALSIIGIKQALFGFKAQIGGYVWKWKLDI